MRDLTLTTPSSEHNRQVWKGRKDGRNGGWEGGRKEGRRKERRDKSTPHQKKKSLKAAFLFS